MVVEHRSLVNYIAYARALLAITPADRVLQFASIGFDTSLEEIFCCLTAGATLVLRPPAMADSIPAFLEACRARGVSVLDLPTALWHELVLHLEEEEARRGVGRPCSAGTPLPESIRLVYIGGEAYSRERLRRWRALVPERVRLLSSYGPSEATIVATVCELSGPAGLAEQEARAPGLGSPVANVQTYVLDAHLQPAPIGVAGELCLCGAGLARGYHNRPALTAERFIAHPFSDEAGARLYRTGDRARVLADGRLEFLGRLDAQVKIRGMRVELGEVEALLLAQPGLRDVVVLAQEDSSGNTRLVAYVVRAGQERSTLAELRTALAARLPGYMLPAALVSLDALPLNLHGKVDRAALRSGSPLQALPAPRADPRGQAERPDAAEMRTLTGIWEEVLGVRPIGPDDDFFELGGHSLLAMRLFHRIEQEYGQRLALSALFEGRTVERLHRLLQQPQAGPYATAGEAVGGRPGAHAARPYAEGPPDQPPPFSVVAVQPLGSRPPFFCLPPPDGGILRYQPLARGLGGDQPVFSVEVRGDTRALLVQRSVEAVAADLVRAIRAHQPEGPYLLGGYSFGGVYAFEAAQQLSAAGQRVPLLVLFDTPCPGLGDAARRGIIARLAANGRFHAQGLIGKLGFHLATVRALPPGERLPYAARRGRRLAARLRRAGERGARAGTPPRPPAGYPLAGAEAETGWEERVRRFPQLRYVPRTFDGQITFFWGVRNPLGKLGAADPRRGWERVAAGGVRIIRIQADHAGVLQDPSQRSLVARHLRRCLREAQV